MIQQARAYTDVVVASDPGLNRLNVAGQVAAGVGATIAAEYGFMQATHLLWATTPPASAGAKAIVLVLAQHHGLTVLAMLIGGIVGMMSAIAVQDPRPRDQALTIGILPVPLLAAMTVAMALEPHRAIGLTGLSLVVGLGVWMRRFVPVIGPRAFALGAMLFIGYFFGFLSAKELGTRDVPELAAILWLAAAVNLALKLVAHALFARGALRRAERAFVARARRVLGAAARVLEAADGPTRQREQRRLSRRLARLGESALMIDAQLIDRTLVPDVATAFSLHHRLFDLELELQTIARCSWRLAPGLDPQLRGELRRILVALRLGRDAQAESLARAVVERTTTRDFQALGHRAEARVQALGSAAASVAATLGAAPEEELIPVAADGSSPADRFTSPVVLAAGNLVGSSQLGVATAEDRDGLAARLHLDAPSQTAIRVALAVGAACAVGSIVSERRFYWAVIAVFIAFMGANTAGEQVIKAGNRVIGTVVGILLGSLLARAIGPTTWSIAVIIPALAVGVYFLRVSYSLMVVGITIMVSQLYVQLGEYTGTLLVLRLEETAIGAAIAMLSALLIFPVGTGRATRLAIVRCLEAIAGLLDHLVTPPSGEEPWSGPRSDQRAVDDAVQQLLVTSRPLMRDPFVPRHDIERVIGLLEGASFLTRTVVEARGRIIEPEPEAQAILAVQGEAARTLAAIVGRRGEPITLPSALDALEQLDRRLGAEGSLLDDPERTATRALVRLDETFATLFGTIVGAAHRDVIDGSGADPTVVGAVTRGSLQHTTV